jgi:ribosomal protein S18 acetylase RimI-like enzyme
MITDALSAVRRSSQVYYAQVADQVTLSCGVAFICPKYPSYFDGNQLREAVLPPGRPPAEAFDEMQSFYASQGLRCFRWVPAGGQSIEPVEAFLTARGYLPNRNLAMSWMRQAEIPPHPKVRLLPGRAMRRALREIILSDRAYAPAHREMLAEVTLERLDNPQYDLFVAMLEDRPAGYGGLLQVGEIGRIENVFVAEACRRRGVGLAIVSGLLTLSRRLDLRITCLETEESNTPAQALYARCGFEVGGSFMEFIAPEAVQEGLFQLSIHQ